MKQRLASLSIAAALAVLSLTFGCQSSSPVASAEPDLTGTAWVVQAIEGRDVISRAGPTLEFGNERLAGTTGCNRYDAPLSLSGNMLRIGKADLTRRVCKPELMGQELRFLAALGATTAYHAEGDSLRLVDEHDVTHIRLARAVISLQSMECSDGVKAISIVMRPAGKDAIEVVMPEATRDLRREPSVVSGTAFSDGHIGIISDGGQVTLEVAGHRYVCSEK